MMNKNLRRTVFVNGIKTILQDFNRKTENIKNRELQLINQHLELVNQRNELVHHLDTQEQAIVEDETIRESLRTGTQNEPDRAERAKKWFTELLK